MVVVTEIKFSHYISLITRGISRRGFEPCTGRIIYDIFLQNTEYSMSGKTQYF